MPHPDPEKRREAMRKYRQKNQERIRQWFRDKQQDPEFRKKRREYGRRYYARPEAKEKIRDGFLRRTYSLSAAQFDEMCVAQGGLCALCRKNPKGRLCVDHCHDTGRVRGLLCRTCNSAIGVLGDSAEAVSRVVTYLSKSIA